jgi:integrase
MGDMGRPKNNDYPAYMTVDGDRGGFVVRNPLSGKKKRYTAAQEQQARETAKALAAFVEQRKQRLLIESWRPTIRNLIARWKAERLPFQPWDASTRQTFLTRLDRIDREKGEELVETIDCVAIETWLTQTAKRADPFNKWRHTWLMLWRFAVSQKLARTNEAEKVERRSTSRKLKSNQKKRGQLDVEGFRAVHSHAEPFLQIAMEAALITAQARKEVCGFRHSDFRNGFLFVIRDKVAGHSDMAFIKIRVTPELEALRLRALKTDDIVSPYLVHRRPERMQRRWIEGKAHWTYVNEPYLTKAFARARDQVERFGNLPAGERPTFHEIRGLAARLLRQLGVAKNDIQELMTHSDQKTTEIYLERGRQALTDDNFITVSAPFTVGEMLSAK